MLSPLDYRPFRLTRPFVPILGCGKATSWRATSTMPVARGHGVFSIAAVTPLHASTPSEKPGCSQRCSSTSSLISTATAIYSQGQRPFPAPLRIVQPSARNTHRCRAAADDSMGSEAASSSNANQPSNMPGQMPKQWSDITAAMDDLKAAAASPSWQGGSIEELTDSERQALASDWGYDRIGMPMPEGAGPSVLQQALPDDAFDYNPWLALRSLVAPLILMALGYWWLWYMHSIMPFWQLIACWLLVGTGYAGIFVAAHEAAKGSLLPDSPGLQDWLGSLLMMPSLYSYETWRLRFMTHVLLPNSFGGDDAAWRPLTVPQVSIMKPWQRTIARLFTSTPLKLWSSIGHWLASFDAFDLKRYYGPMRAQVLWGWAVPFFFMGLIWPAIITAGGLSGWINCWLMPWLVFHFWLSLITLLHHTAPHIPFKFADLDYDFGQAAVNGTVTVTFPRWLEFLLNNANYDLPQHIHPNVPFYKAPQVLQQLKQKLEPFTTEARFNLRLLVNHIARWQVYDTSRNTYITFDEAVQLADQLKELAKSEASATADASSASTAAVDEASAAAEAVDQASAAAATTAVVDESAEPMEAATRVEVEVDVRADVAQQQQQQQGQEQQQPKPGPMADPGPPQS